MKISTNHVFWALQLNYETRVLQDLENTVRNGLHSQSDIRSVNWTSFAREDYTRILKLEEFQGRLIILCLK